MKMNNKVYDVLKWFALVCLPALVIAIPSLFDVWQIPYGEQIGKTLSILAVLLGSLLGVSNITYNNNKVEDYNVDKG